MTAMIFGPDLFVVVLATAIFVVPAVAIINAATKPTALFSDAGYSKAKWMSALIILTFLGSIIGTGVAIRYLTSTRPNIKKVQEGVISPVPRILGKGDIDFRERQGYP